MAHPLYAETIVEINDVSDNYNGQLLLYRGIPATAAFEKPTAVKLEGDDLERIRAYFDLISRVLIIRLFQEEI